MTYLIITAILSLFFATWKYRCKSDPEVKNELTLIVGDYCDSRKLIN